MNENRLTRYEWLTFIATTIIALGSLLNFAFGAGKALWAPEPPPTPTVVVVHRR